MPTQNISINLLEQDIFSTSIMGKILTWALTIGRYIIVFTELIVIISFLSRFKLDRELTDLNSDIVSQVAIIDSYGDLEIKVNELQKQIAVVKDKKSQSTPIVYLDTLIKYMPVDIKLERIQLDATGFQFSAESLSRSSLTLFVQRLQKDPAFSEVSVSQLENNSQEGTITFQVKVTLI